MYPNNIRKALAIAVVTLTALLIGGTVTVASAFSVDVKNLHYSDDSGRSIMYDFSAGTVGTVLPNAILLDGSAEITRPSDETGTNYLWGQAPELPAISVTLPTAGNKAVISPVDAVNGGVAVLFASGPSAVFPPQTLPTNWFYSLELGNFNVDMTAQKTYEFDIGLGRDEASGPYNNATLNVVWVKGYYNGVMYPDNTLIIQARVQNGETEFWASTPIVRTGLDPAATTLMFDLSVDSGNHFFAAAQINSEDMTNLGEYTLTTGAFQRLPDLYPYIYMEERNASTIPQATVQSFHFQNDGKYYASFHVQDPLHQASAVSVTGNGNSYVPSEGVLLEWNELNKSWNSPQSYEIGTTPVTEPWPSFTFTFTPQTGGAAIDSQTTNITGYVTEFASNLAPQGSFSANPVFSWSAPPGGASGYGIELNDGTNRIWSIYGIPVTQTSVPYNGQPLTNGKTYNYHILSQLEQNGVWNVSFASGSFTYTGTGATTISFNGWVKTSPNWPSTDGLQPVVGAAVNALEVVFPLEDGDSFGQALTNDDGAFSLAGIPASSTFRLVIPTPASTTYVPVLGKFMNWNADIQALLPFVLFTQEQYAAFDNVTGSGMILGRVALKNSPTTFLSGATIEALEWTPGNPPVLGATYPVTYTSGSSTQADGIYMVKNVPTGKLVQLVATLPNHTFEFNYSVIPVQTGSISEESFFGTEGSTAQVTIYSSEAAFTAVAANTTLIGFEDRDTSSGRMTFAGNEYAGQGITFASPNGQQLYVDPPPTSNWTWSSKYLSPGNAPFMSGDSNEDSLTLTFSSPVAAVGWTFLDMPNPYAVTIRVYDGNNNLIHEAPNGTGIVVNVEGHGFWGIVSPMTPIARVEIIDTANNGDDVAYDNFRFAATVTPATISFSGMLKKFSDDTPVGGASVEMVGNASIKTTTAADGTFTLPGLPSGTGFMVKFTGDTGVYVPTYTGFMLSTVDMTSPRSFNLFTPNELSYWGVTSGNGVIRGRVMNGANQTAGYVSGATVSYASLLGNTYTVKYENNEGILTTGTGTSANGKYYILNVAEGDTVTVSAAHPYYSFPQPRQFATHGAAAHQGLVNGAAVSGRVAIGGHIMNTADPAAGIKGATIEQFGAASPINATTSNLDGAFYLSVPATTTLQLKFSKPKDTTLAPTYSANMSFGADNLAIGDFNLFLKTILSNSVDSGGWGVTPGKGIIRARVKDQAGNYLGGATVTAQGVSKSYAVCYDNACTLEATPDTGRYIVKDVDDGDTVTVTAQKQGWTFNTRFFPTHADSVHQGSITGATLALSAAGQTFTAAGTGSVNVVAPDGVAWQAVSNASWIHITGSSGTGNGVVSYTVDANTGDARTGTITIGGQTFTVSQTAVGTGYPIATTTGQEFAGSAAFDGTNYLVGIQGDASARNNITAQLVSPSGALVGSRISVGRTGGLPLVAFDGTNYLMVWFDDLVNAGQLYGVLISPTGAITKPAFPIDLGPLSVKRDIGGIAFGGGTYLAVYYKTDSIAGKDIVYGRMVSTAGVIGNEFRISSGYGSQAMNNVAFDGTNFFVVWNDHATNNAVKGRLVSLSGTLVGSEITVKADNSYPNDNPLTVAFAGGKYLVAWTDQVSTAPNNWDVFGQLVDPDGLLSGGRISISTAPGQQFGPSIAFDGTNYLISWTDMRNDVNGDWACDASEGTCMDIRGQLVSQSGALVGSEIIINNDPGNQMGGFGGQAVNGKLFGLVNTGVSLVMTDVGSGGVAGGDVYGMFMTAGEKIPMMNFTDSRMNLFLYDPVSQAMDTVVQNNQAGLAHMNNEQTLLAYTKFLNDVPNNGRAYNPCLYNIVAKTTTCLATLTVEEDSVAFDSSGKIIFIDKSDGVLKKMDTDWMNIVTMATPASPYRFTYFSLSPDRQRLMIVEESRSADYYATNQSRLVQMNADGTNRTIVQDAVLGEWNMLVWKADSSRVFYYYHTFNGLSEPSVVKTPHYVVIAVPGGTRTDLTASSVGGKEENVCSFTKSGNLLSWMNHELYNGQTGALIATRDDVPSMMEARVGFDRSGEIYFADLDGTNFRKFVESSTPVNGVCGTANGQAFTSVPTANLCSVGTPSVVAGSGPWTWSCAGSDGGANDSCSANVQTSSTGFQEDFSATVLDPLWQVVTGRGRYSLSDNPGHLRYYLEGPQAYSGSSLGVVSTWSPSLTLIRPFDGDNWVFKTKANYNIRWQGTGAQYNNIYIAFGEGGNNYLRISRGTDQWYGANILAADLTINGQVAASSNALRAPNDVVANDWLKYPYWYEITRSGQCITLRYSYDGTNYSKVFSYSLPAQVAAVQRVIIDANVWTTAGSYTDWDYMYVDPTAIQTKADVDGDGAANLADAILILKVMAGMNPGGIRTDYPTCGADVDCDGKIGLPEAIHILQV
ncbi:MAG: hypothetical protein KJ649_03795, partial [Proteobacteria bacterium]|nr:hypothetical protein [Pseudomonadota bacterium]